MTANIEAMLTGLLSVAHTPERAEHAARSVLDQHAHQLAERARKAECCGADVCACREIVADAVDPEVQR